MMFPGEYIHLKPNEVPFSALHPKRPKADHPPTQQGYAPLYSDFDSFYTFASSPAASRLFSPH